MSASWTWSWATLYFVGLNNPYGGLDPEYKYTFHTNFLVELTINCGEVLPPIESLFYFKWKGL